ncbi:MAG: hypothetical protein ACYC7A_22670 [Thermoanaerobaculia bacterium]
MSDLERMFRRSFVEHLSAATEASRDHLTAKPDLAAQLETVRVFGNQVLLEAVPSDFDSLGKIGYFPFTEASTEFSYAINLALGGAHKPAYQCLRSYLELALVGLYFLSLPVSDRSGRRWLQGDDATPFRAAIVRSLRANTSFATAADHVGFFELLDEVYGRLSDRTHTRGESHGHAAVSKANVPRFVPEALELFVTELRAASSLVATGFAILRPVVLVPLPLDEKFGLNPPLSGFLQDFEVGIVRELLPPEHLQWLEARAATDDEAVSVKEWMESMPDLTREEWDLQIKAQEQWFREMGPRPGDVESE